MMMTMMTTIVLVPREESCVLLTAPGLLPCVIGQQHPCPLMWGFTELIHGKHLGSAWPTVYLQRKLAVMIDITESAQGGALGTEETQPGDGKTTGGREPRPFS